MDLEPVTEKHVRKLLNIIEELRYKYNQCGRNALGENLGKIILVKCIPKDVMKPRAIHLEKATTFQQVREMIMRQMHDELIGMLEGEQTRPLYAFETEKTETEEQNKKAEEWTKDEEDQWAAALKRQRW